MRSGLLSIPKTPKSRWPSGLASCSLAVWGTLGLGPMAQAQVFVGAGQDGGALILSNFASDDTPVLMIEAPPEPAPRVPVVLATAAPSNAVSQTGLALNSAIAAVTDATPVLDFTRPKLAPAVPIYLLPLFTWAAREHAVPVSLLMAVAAVESNFNPRAMSPKGALGLMQLMPATARQHGVREVWSVSDNLRGGAAHLRGLLARFPGQTGLALAAYNAGEQAVVRAGGRIPEYEETQRYVPKVLAWGMQYEQLLGERAAGPKPSPSGSQRETRPTPAMRATTRTASARTPAPPWP